jgi:hypothetical protein
MWANLPSLRPKFNFKHHSHNTVDLHLQALLLGKNDKWGSFGYT